MSLRVFKCFSVFFKVFSVFFKCFFFVAILVAVVVWGTRASVLVFFLKFLVFFFKCFFLFLQFWLPFWLRLGFFSYWFFVFCLASQLRYFLCSVPFCLSYDFLSAVLLQQWCPHVCFFKGF